MATRAFSFNRFLSKCCAWICIFLVGCGQFQIPLVSPPSSSPTCEPSINPYMVQSRSTVKGLYRDYRNNFTNLNMDKQKAFSQLIEIAQHSSDQREFAIDTKQMVRITITYLDPLLVQYILLNDELVNKSGEDAGTFESALDNDLARLADRKELLFVITFTSSHYDPQAYGGSLVTVKLPVAQLTLFNTGNLSTLPTHFDHNLDENIIISRGPASGVVGYPIAITSQNGCTDLMDQWTTSLTLDASPVIVNNTMEFKSQFWRIRYAPLMQDNTQPAVNNTLPTPIIPVNQLGPTEQPPTPFWNPGFIDPTNPNKYWEEMSRYLWKFFVTEINR